jgi:hypothetical protein
MLNWRKTMGKYVTRFTKTHTRNGYAAMGNSARRPHYAGMNSKRSVAEAIAAERAAAARASKIKAGKKK